MKKLLTLALAILAPGILGTIGSVIGIASGLNSMFNQPSAPQGYAGGTGSSIPFYVPTGQSMADQAWQATLSALGGSNAGYRTQIDPVLQAAYAKLLGIDTSGMVQAGQSAGQDYSNFANLGSLYASLLGGQAGQAFGAGSSILNTGFDPQNDLYNRTFGKLQDQVGAITSMYGLGSSPAGAGIMSDAAENFNIDWQNQQLARQAQAIKAMAQSGQVGSAELSGSLGAAGGVPGARLAAGTTPVTTAQSAYTLPINAANTYYGAAYPVDLAPYYQYQNQIIPYLNYGTGAGANAFGAAMTNQGQQQAGQAAGVNALMTGLSGTYNPFTGTNSGGLANSQFGQWLNSMFTSGGLANTNLTGSFGGADVGGYGAGAPY